MKVQKIFLIISFMLVLAGCSNKSSNITTEGIDWEAAQYHKELSFASAENESFYTVQGYPLLDKKVKLIYYYDGKTNTTYPLCSNTSCNHLDANCEAYVDENSCLNDALWYYKDRLYMVERTSEYDNLVSYDKRGRDKIKEAELSKNGLSVLTSSAISTMCINDGGFFYFLINKDSLDLYRFDLTDKGIPQLINSYQAINENNQMLSMYSSSGAVYFNRIMETKDGTKKYSIDSFDTVNKKFSEIISFTDKPEGLRGNSFDWNNENCFDNEGDFYFTSVDEDDLIINKLKLATKEITELFVIEGNGHTEKNKADTDYVKLIGFDGKQIYIRKGVNINYPNDIKDSNNYLYLIGTDGKLNNTIEINKAKLESADRKTTTSSNISFNYLGTVGENVIISTNEYRVDSDLDLSVWNDRFNKYLDDKKQPSISMLFSHELNNTQEKWKSVTYNNFK
jgi:hypothetical protein